MKPLKVLNRFNFLRIKSSHRRFKMIIYFLMCIYFMSVASKSYNGPTFEESLPNIKNIWHSYVFNTGAGNREELYFSNVELNNNFAPDSDIIMWKSLQIETEIVIVGLSNDFLLITTTDGGNNSHTHKQEIQGPGRALAVFQKWSAKAQGIESFVIVAVHSAKESYKLMWYQILNGGLKFLWGWQYPGNVIHMDVIEINYESKLLVVSEKYGSHKNPSAEIYSFHMSDEWDMWMFEKIILNGTPSSVGAFETSDNVFFYASYPSSETIHIFKYSKSSCINTSENKHFVSHQKIFSIGLRSVTPFQMGFRWYLAVASSSSLIYYIGENLLFQPLSTRPLGHFNDWLVIPVDTYREDTLLLADSGSDVSIVACNGDKNLRIIGSFTKLACRDDVNCSEKMKRLELNKSTAFTHNGHQSIILSVRNEIPFFYKLFTILKPLPNKAALRLEEISNERVLLERDYKNQLEQINQFLSQRENSSKVHSAVFSDKMFESKPGPETASSTKHRQQVLTELNGLKAVVKSLNVDVKKFMSDLKLVFSEKDGQNSKTFHPKNATDGITFLGDVVINELNLSSINGHSVNELLSDSFRKNNVKKIGGKKTLKKLNADNVIFEKLGGTLACDIVFTDDPWESENKNIINGDIVWDNKLNILGDMKILEEEASSVKTPRRTLKPVYDALDFKELEVTEDFHVQRNINGQPIILPVHGGHLNILDVVNHARFEMVNVKQNLDVEIINGQNFSSIADKILRGTSQPDFASVQVDGVFSAPAIQADQFNGVDLASGLQAPGADAGEMSEKLLANSPPVAYEEGNSLKRNRNENLKRIIHVFDNLEIDGILFSNNINNLSWRVLNDTIKKGEETVNLVGTKTFEKSLRTPKAILSGTLNGRFTEHIMTNDSDQVLRYPQDFDVVQFKNLSLEGAWNGTYVNQLNESVMRLSVNNGRESRLTFQNECFMNILNVRNVVNDLNVGSEDYRQKNGKTNLKSIKASHVILHGSLITNNKINNMNITDFNMLRISLKNPEIIDQDIYRYNVSVSGDLNVETLNFNDVSSIINSKGDANLIENFMSGEVSKIKKLLVKGNITTSRGINGFDLPRIFEKGMRITRPAAIKGNVTFENIVYFDNINVTNSIDGVSLKNLEKDIAFDHSQVYLTGPKNFSSVSVTRNMRARTLNGHVVEEMVSLEGDHTMEGPVHINGNVIVRGNITSYSAVNNASVTDLLQTYSTGLNSYIHSGDLNLSNEHVRVWNLVVVGRIQNVSLNALINDSVRKDDGLIDVSGKKTFKGGVKFKENVTVRELIHGVNFSKFYSDLTFVNKPAKVGGTVTIQESAFKDLDTTAHFNSTLINNIDTNDWLEECIPLDTYGFVDGRKTFAEVHSLQDISSDFINGHLPSAMITLKEKQYIPTRALFPRIHATSDVAVEGLVNGKNLPNQFQDSVLLNGPQTLTGKTVFNGEFFVNGSLTVDTVKGRRVSSLVTLDTEQVIKTPLRFRGLVTAKRNVDNLKLVNNISLRDWNERSVLLNRNQVLNGLWTVKGKIKAGNIQGDGLLDSVSLRNLSQDIRKGKSIALELKNATEQEYSTQCLMVDDLSQQFSHLPYLLHQFVIVHDIEAPSVIDSVITFKIGEIDNLIVAFHNECLSSLYHWNKESITFDYRRQINIGPVGRWLAIHRDEATYLITSSPSSLVCEESLQRGNVWVFRGEADGYAHLVTTNAFVDIAQENGTSDEFFTIDENGVLQQWTLQSGNVTFKVLLNLGSGNHRFIDFRILRGLTVSNGREIKQIVRKDDGRIVQRTHLFPNGHLMALPIDGKVLTALVLRDKIVVYESLLEEKVHSIIHTYKAGSVLWLNYGPMKQAFLIVASHHKLIEVYEYKGVSGLVKKMSIQMFSNRLQSVDLPVDSYRLDKFVIVVQKKKLSFARAEMFGDYFQKGESLC